MRERATLRRLTHLAAAQRAQQLISFNALDSALNAERRESTALADAEDALDGAFQDWQSALADPHLTSALVPLYADAARQHAEDVERKGLARDEAGRRADMQRTRHAGSLAQAQGIEALRKRAKARVLRKSEERALAVFTDLAHRLGEAP